MATLGQIGLVTGRGIVPAAVRYGTAAEVSHVIIDAGDGMVVSAQLGGAVLRPIEHYPAATWSRYEYRPGQAQAVADFARAHLGAPYNLAAAAVVVLSRALTMHLPPDRTLRFYQCAQLAEDALLEAGVIPYRHGREPGPASPRTFQLEFTARGWYQPRTRTLT
jgi:hypothetical protein